MAVFTRSLWASVQYLESTNVILIPKHILNHSPVADQGVWFDQSKIWCIQHWNLVFDFTLALEASLTNSIPKCVPQKRDPCSSSEYENEHMFLFVQIIDASKLNDTIYATSQSIAWITTPDSQIHRQISVK
jgi:hypothetical protein